MADDTQSGGLGGATTPDAWARGLRPVGLAAGLADAGAPGFSTAAPTRSPTSEVNVLPGEATLSAYDPSLQERIGAGIQGSLESAGMSRGLSQDYGRRWAGAAYYVPGLGSVIAGDYARRAAEGGDTLGAITNGLAAAPIPWGSVLHGAGGVAARMAAALPIPASALARGAAGALDRVPASAAAMADRAVADGVGSVAPSIAPSITAYHGSPHDFDRFRWDPQVRGSGEGAQAFGDGLYFAGNENVAKNYREVLSQSILPESSREPMLEWARKYGAQPGEAEPTIDAAIKGDKAAIADLKSRYAPRDLFAKGHMYEVNIGSDPEHFLDWDKPLNEQGSTVQGALNGLLPPAKPLVDNHETVPIGSLAPDDRGRQAHYVRGVTASYTSPLSDGTWASQGPGETPASFHSTQQDAIAASHSAIRNYLSGAPASGRAVHDLLSGEYGGPAGAAEVLKSRGIPGIRYLDGSSRSAGQGSHNFVVFDPATIAIIRKYGLAGLGVGAAATGGALTMNPSDAQAAPAPAAPRDGYARGGSPHISAALALTDHGPPPGGPNVANMVTGGLHAPVPGRTDHLPISVPDGAFVIPADVVSALGEGNTSAGMAILTRMFGGQSSQPAGPSRGRGVDIMAAGGEFVVSPQAVASRGSGNLSHGHAILAAFVKNVRKQAIATLKRMPGPK